MKPLFSARVALAFSLLTGLLAGALFAPSAPASTPVRYWQVRVSLAKDQPPVIESATLLETASPALPAPGDSALQLISASGEVLRQLTFQPKVGVSDLPGTTPRVPYLFLLPDHPSAAFILLRTPQGETRYELRR